MTPRSCTDLASACSAASSKCRRGWSLLGLMSSTARSRRSGVAPSCPGSGAETERIAASPRPMPRSATGRALLGQLEVGVRARGVRVMVDHRAAVARRLADPDVARDDRVEDELGEVLAHLALDVARQSRAAV